MQYSIVKACLLALAATTSVVAQTAGFNVITKPAEGELVAAGKTYTVEWIPTLPSQDVSLVVLQGASNVTLQLGATIASGVPSSVGKYSWAIPADASFAVYGIKIQLDSNPEVFQYSNQFKVASAVAKPSATTVEVSEVSTTAAATTLPAAIVDDIVVEAPMTLTQYETRVQTISSCAPTVTDCPYGKVTSTIIPIIPTLSTVISHETVAANCSCTKGQDGKITSTGTAPVQIPTHYPATTLVQAPSAPVQNPSQYPATTLVPATTLAPATTLVPAPYQNGTNTNVASTAPVNTAPVVLPTGGVEVPTTEQPAPSPEQPHPYAPLPVVPGPAGTAAPSEAPQPTAPVFTGAAGKVASSLTLVGAAALSLMFL